MITVKTTQDQMEAKLTIKEEEDFPSYEEIKRELNDNMIKYGIKEGKLEQIIEKEKSVENEIIAKGKEPVPGKDSELVWHIEQRDAEGPKIDESGKADFKYVKEFPEVEEGKELVSKLPATEGKPGKNVRGEKVEPPEPKEVELPQGKNTKVSEDGLNLTADKKGYVYIKNGKVNIIRDLRISGDVDYSTGNIKHDGKIIIEGDVLSGFRVESEESIIVKGNVEAADIYAHTGDVKVECGILGKDRAKILAGGNLECGFIQDATVKVKGDVLVDHYSINSNVHAGGKVELLKNEGTVRGGKVISEEKIDVLQAGSKKGIKTILGIDLTQPDAAEEELTDIIAEKENLTDQLSLLDKKIEFLELLKERVEKLSQQKKEELHNYYEEKEKVQENLSEIQETKENLIAKNRSTRPDRAIFIQDKLYSNVLFNFGEREYFNDAYHKNVMVYNSLDEIVIEDIEEEVKEHE